MARYEAASIEQVPPGEMISVTLGNAQVLIANLSGTYYALDDLCPHLAVPLSQGTINAACVVCPGHGSEFELATGKVTKWVGRKPGFLSRMMEGKAHNARMFPITIENGKIHVDI